MVSYSIRYYEGFKYQLAEDYQCATPIFGVDIKDREFHLDVNGTLKINAGFAWDGASGPTFDSRSSMRASLVHDVFCVCMRDGRLDYSKYQDTVNQFFKQQCIEDGMWEWRASLWHTAVEFADAGNPNQGPDRKILST